MRIKTLHIQRYGPLAGFGPSDLPRFSLVYGPNERGKTLLIDAVLRMLFKNELGRRVKYFGNLHRVDEQPEGYVVLDIAGEEIKLERDATLTKLIDIGPSEFRNIFVVRDSDLSFDAPGTHFTRVSEKLAGLQSSRILKIKKALQKRGRLTNPGSGAGLANNAETEHIGRRFKIAETCLEEIDSAHDALKRRDFDTLERVLLDRETRLGTLSEELTLLGKAKRHKRFEKAREHLEALEAVERNIEACRHLRAEDLDHWKTAEHDLKRLREDLEEAKQEEVRVRELSLSLSGKQAEMRQSLGLITDRVAAFEDDLSPVLVEHERLSRLAAEAKPTGRVWLAGVSVASVLLVFSLVATIVDTKAFYGPISLVFVAALIFFGWRLIVGRQTDSKLSEATENIKLTASRLGIDLGTASAAGKYKYALEEELQRSRAELEQTSAMCIAAGKEKESTALRVVKIRGEIRSRETAVEELRRRSGVDTVDEMDRAIKTRTEIIGEKKSLVAVLCELTGVRNEKSNGESGATDTSKWRHFILDYFNGIPDGAEMLTYDEAREQALMGEVAALKDAVAKMGEDLNAGKDLLRGLEVRVREAAPVDAGDIVLRTVEDLVRVRRILHEFVKQVEIDKRDALAALEVFEEIESEEKARVLELFGADANVSSYFGRITQGRYTEVAFDLETAGIRVTQSDGAQIDADKLSGGALDQLHFAIRLSIGERLFPDGRGLLILDDPFIKSDPGRLETQVNLLRDIVEDGWQVIYFSAKEEVKTILTPDIESGSVGVFEVGEPRVEPSKPVGPLGI